MTRRSYLSDASLFGMSRIIEISDRKIPILRLSETLFHPQCGGQKSDRGTVGSAKVLHVAHNGGRLDHYVDSARGLSVGRCYPVTIDAEWRQLNAVYHSAGHLVASVVEMRYPKMRVVAGHQWPGEASVDFEGNIPRAGELTTILAEEVALAIRHPNPVVITGGPFSKRSVKIGLFADIPCVGTHISNTNMIGSIKIGRVIRYGNRAKVHFSVVSPTQEECFGNG
jgi:alanyl-tRNA synthetase